MKKFLLLFAAFITILLCGMCASAESAPTFDDGSVIVTLDPSNRGAKIAAFGSDIPDFGNIGVTDVDVLMSPPAGRIALMSLNAKPKILKLTLSENGVDSVADAIEKLESMPEVKYAEPNYYLKLCETDDPYYTDGSQYALDKVSAPDLWDLDIDCSNTCVAMIDSGARVTHEDLADNIWTNPNEIPNNNFDDDGNGYIDDVHGWNCFSDNNDLSDNVGHGTHVAGIVSAATNNSKGVASVARNAKIAVIKAFNTSTTTVDMVIKAIDYANSMDFKIVNASFALNDPKFVNSMNSAIQACPDTLFICAAGNHGLNIDINPIYPASYDFPNVLAVANITESDALSASSNYGVKTVDIAAPGNNIMSTINDSDSAYGPLSGTSMASPLVASAAAVVLAVNPNLTPSEVVEILTKSADSSAPLEGKVKGAARLNAHKAALMSIESTKTPVPSESPKPSDAPIYSESPVPSGSIEPSPEPSESTEPSAAPTGSATPSQVPAEPPRPSTMPSQTPTVSARPSQTPAESPKPSAAPVKSPEPSEPTGSYAPSAAPSATAAPTAIPSSAPVPTQTPTAEPSNTPVSTQTPTAEPSSAPVPTQTPTAEPSSAPVPTQTPTAEPSSAPPVPTQTPTAAPTYTSAPSAEASAEPSNEPQNDPLTINGVTLSSNKVSVRITGSQTAESMIFAAAYDESGVLTDFAFDTLRQFENETIVDITLDHEKSSSISVFVWSNANEAKPLCEKYVLDL